MKDDSEASMARDGEKAAQGADDAPTTLADKVKQELKDGILE